MAGGRKNRSPLLASGALKRQTKKSRTQTQAVQHARRAVIMAKILELRVQGLSERDIAKDLGFKIEHFSSARVNELLYMALDDIVLPEAERLKRLELARLDQIINGHFEGATTGDVGATHALLACVDRRNRLLGIGADQRVQQLDKDGKAADPARPIINLTIARRPD
jgi:hypothetical protein